MRTEIARKFNSLSKETKMKIINKIEDGMMKGKSFKDVSKIDLGKMSNEMLEKINKLIESGTENPGYNLEEMRNLQNSEYSDNDLYFSDEEDDKEGNKPKKNDKMKKLSDILANMEDQNFYDSEDD